VKRARAIPLALALALAPAPAACGEVLEPAPAPVKVTVLTYAGDGLPEPGAWMIFHDTDGRLVSEGPVDAMGKLEAPLPAGGSVTEVRIVADTAASLRAEITTITGVHPGDDLTFGFKARPTSVSQGGQTTMTASFTPVAGAADHHFYTTCGVTSAGTTSPVTLSFRDSCHGPTFDLLVVASGGALTVPQFIMLSNVEYQSGQSFTVPGGYSTMGSFRVTATNVPAELSSLAVTRSSMFEHTAVGSQTIAVGDPAAGTVAVDVPFATGVGARSEVSLTFSRPDAFGTQQHSLRTSMLTTGVEVDLGRQQVPWLKAPAVTATALTWTIAVPGDLPDGMVSLWSGRWATGGRTVSVGWRIAHPASATGLTLPRLSDMHAAVDPQAQTVTVLPDSGSVTIVDYDVVTGYDEFRQQPDTLVTPSIELMGAFVGMPLERRMYMATFFAP
jgi:hypothetical protein